MSGMSGAPSPQTAAPTTGAPTATPAAPAPKPRWWRRRWVRIVVPLAVIVVALVVILLGLAIAVIGRVEDDPRSLAPRGSAALVQVLRDQGVTIDLTDAVQPSTERLTAGDTLVVTSPDRLGSGQWEQLLAERPADVVLIRPGPGTLFQLGVPARAVSFNGIPVPPTAQCTDPDAQRAESLEPGYVTTVYAPGDGVTSCFILSEGAAYVTYERDGTRFHLLAAGNRNNELDKSGNASFTMAVLGHQAHAVWLVAKDETSGPSGEDTDPPPMLLPRGWLWGWLMVGVGFIIVCVWRGRRLGPILSERLPVKVRASETLEGHGRLYHRMGVRDRAAAALRAAVVRRLGRRFGQSDPLILAGLIADQTGIPAMEVREALTGRPPTTDDELVALKKTLDHIEQEVRTL